MLRWFIVTALPEISVPTVASMPAKPDLRTIRVGVACPMANEGEDAVKFVRAVLSHCEQFPFRSVTFFAVLDNVTVDNTRDLLDEYARTEPRLSVVWSPENRCVVDAYVRGYREALNAGCDWILEIDAGFSHNPAEAPRLFEQMATGQYDCVFGSRFSNGGGISDSSWKRYLVSSGGSFLTNLLLGTRMSDMTSGFELFHRDTLQAVLDRGIRSRAHFFQTEIKVFCRKRRYVEVPITYRMASPRLSNKAVVEALQQLGSMFFQRLTGRL
jgi:dolichol-phosphate mannosyltransferase